MRQVNIHEAKTHFSELIAAVERGETIVIARRGKPVARVGPNVDVAAEAKPKRVFGQWKDRMWVDPSFFEPRSDEELEEWNKPLEALAGVAPVQRKSAG